MKEYNIIIRVDKVEKINNFDIGNKIIFNMKNNNYISTIKEVRILKNNDLSIICLIKEDIYNYFTNENSNNNYYDFSIEKCIINNINFIDEYLCY